jgi:hypothetical protein
MYSFIRTVPIVSSTYVEVNVGAKTAKFSAGLLSVQCSTVLWRTVEQRSVQDREAQRGVLSESSNVARRVALK